jgi:hypothetical protein
MTEKKKREKVVAEITLAHLTQFARELGRRLSQEEAIAFLNQDGRAYAMWKLMMHAGEEYIKSSLERPQRNPLPISRSSAQRTRLAV